MAVMFTSCISCLYISYISTYSAKPLFVQCNVCESIRDTFSNDDFLPHAFILILYYCSKFEALVSLSGISLAMLVGAILCKPAEKKAKEN